MRWLIPSGYHFCGVDVHCYVNILYDWQTLIGGLIAIGAALYAGSFVRKQITASEKIEDDRLGRRAKAVRAVLPLTLTRFTDFAEDGANVLKVVQGPAFSPPTPGVRAPIEPPQLPQVAISDLERAIEATIDDLAVQIMTQLAGHSQVLHSIIGDMVVDVNARGNALRRVDPNLPAFEIRVARVHAAASRLFSWARGESDTPERPTWDHVESSLALLNLGSAATAQLINRRRERDDEPLGW